MKTSPWHKKLSRTIPWLPVFMTIEFVGFTLNCLFLCGGGILNAILIRGNDIFKVFCVFQGWCCLATLFIYPLFMILSLWKRFLCIIKYGFLLIGGLCIISSIIALLFICLGNWGCIKPNYFSVWLAPLIGVWGIDCIIRYWCCRKYGRAFYSASLLKIYKNNTQDFRKLFVTLLFYITAYITLLQLTNIQNG